MLWLCGVFDLPELNKGSDLSFPFFSVRCSVLGASDRFLIELKFGFFNRSRVLDSTCGETHDVQFLNLVSLRIFRFIILDLLLCVSVLSTMRLV